MYLAHYLLPFITYFFYRSKIVFGGLLLGNLVDLDHVYSRLVGTVPWEGNMCGFEKFWECNGFFGYPLHSFYVILFIIMISMVIFPFMIDNKKDKKLKWMFWICIGFLIHFALDFIQLVTGFAF
jgi:hypothetical protein